MRVDRNYQLKRATLSWKKEDVKAAATASPSPVASASAESSVAATPTPVAKSKKLTITCVKGKTVKKVTGLTPKCPSGFKKK
jgi:hypothetical protein